MGKTIIKMNNSRQISSLRRLRFRRSRKSHEVREMKAQLRCGDEAARPEGNNR